MEYNDKNTAALIEFIKQQTRLNATLQKTIEELNADSKILREQIDFLTKKLFGRKSEKTSVITGQVAIDGIFTGEFDDVLEDSTLFKEEPILVTKKRTRKGYSREKALKNLPQENRIHTLSDEDKVCLVDGDQLKPVGKKFIRTEIEYTPPSMKLINVYTETFECRTCRKEGRSYLIQAKANKPLLQHSMASPSVVAWTMYQKFVNHMPLYRQSKDWENLGMQVPRNTLSNWIIKISEDWLSKVVDVLHTKIIDENYIHADESAFQVHKEKDRKDTTKSYMWIYATGVGNLYPIRIFDYQPTRGGSNAANFLKDYKGYLHTDGYKAYDKVEGVTRVLCWSHVRRYFTDALPKELKSIEATLPKQGIAYCNKIFDIEASLSELSPEERKEQRLLQVKPVIEAFWSWIDSNMNKVLMKSKIGKALQYTFNQRNGLVTFLEDGNCAISNNLVENSIRPMTVGRRNWLFSGCPEGATASAVVYSLVETAKANELNPFKYLKYLLTNLPKIQAINEVAEIERMLPWQAEPQALCTNKIKSD